MEVMLLNVLQLKQEYISKSVFDPLLREINSKSPTNIATQCQYTLFTFISIFHVNTCIRLFLTL